MPFDHLGPVGNVVEEHHGNGGSWKVVETDLGRTTITGTADFVNATTVYQSGVTVSPNPDSEEHELVSNEEHLEEMGYFK